MWMINTFLEEVEGVVEDQNLNSEKIISSDDVISWTLRILTFSILIKSSSDDVINLSKFEIRLPCVKLL